MQQRAFPPRDRINYREGFTRIAIVIAVMAVIAFFLLPALQNEVAGKGGDPWFDVPPFKRDYTIPPPPSWVNDSLPPRQLPTRRGYGNGWRECRPGPNGWECSPGGR